MGVERVMMNRSDRMVKSGTQYLPPVKNDRIMHHHYGNSGVNRLGYFQRSRPRKPPLPPPPKIINRKRRPPPPPPPPPRIQYKRRQGVTKVLTPPFKPYKPPPKKKVSPVPKKHYKPPSPPPPQPPTPSSPTPTYQYQYLPPAQPTPYQVRMSSISPLAINNRTAFITGYHKLIRKPLSIDRINTYFRSVLDPYALLALLGFLVFMFYIIYNFINNTGDGGRSFSDIISDSFITIFNWDHIDSKHVLKM